MAEVLFFMIAYFWWKMHTQMARIIGNEKLIGELLGFSIAVVNAERD